MSPGKRRIGSPPRCAMCTGSDVQNAPLITYEVNGRTIIHLHADCLELYTSWHGADDITPLYPPASSPTEL